MSDKEENIRSGSKKKYLYLDKFLSHLDEDAAWKKTARTSIDRLKRKVDLGLWADIVTFLIALSALGVALLK